jgi:hypothetical protein
MFSAYYFQRVIPAADTLITQNGIPVSVVAGATNGTFMGGSFMAELFQNIGKTHDSA